MPHTKTRTCRSKNLLIFASDVDISPKIISTEKCVKIWILSAADLFLTYVRNPNL